MDARTSGGRILKPRGFVKSKARQWETKANENSGNKSKRTENTADKPKNTKKIKLHSKVSETVNYNKITRFYKPLRMVQVIKIYSLRS